MEFKKVFSSDYDFVSPLIDKFDGGSLSKEKKRLLFNSKWSSAVDFVGVMIVDKNKPIAYLGLIFSDREIDGSKQIFCNLSSLIIDPDYRGQKLSHKIIQYLQSLGNFTLTAITPIPSLYKMYESNGFQSVNDYRTAFWKHYFLKKSQSFQIFFNKDIPKQDLSTTECSILEDHLGTNCTFVLFKNKQNQAFLVLKNKIAQRRKFITNKWLNYLDYALRKSVRKGFLENVMTCPEVHYCSNYKFVLENISDFAALFFEHNKQFGSFCLRTYFVNQYQCSYPLRSNYWHSRQLFYSKELQEKDYDTLYSEIFLLDM